jgi:hypothetical protein
LDFDGVDDYIQSNLVTTAIDNVSIEAWINWGGNTGASQVIFYNGDASTSGYGLLIENGTNKLQLLLGGITIVNSNDILPVNKWHHIALVRESGTWKLYMDNNIQSLSSTSTPNVPTAQTRLSSNLTTQAFKGKMVDFPKPLKGRLFSNSDRNIFCIVKVPPKF